MKNKTLVKGTSRLFIAAAVLMIFSSCNRGYGCPTNFSTDIFDVARNLLIMLF